MTMKSLRHLPGFTLLLLLIATATPGFAENAAAPERRLPSEIRETLRGPIELFLTNRARYEGSIMGFEDDTLTIMVRLPGGGEAELSFASDQIERLIFPGSEHLQTLGQWMDDPDRAEDALLLFRAFYDQQARYFSLLRTHERLLFVEYVRFALRQNRPFLAIAMAEAIGPFIDDPRIRRDIEDGVLLATLEGGLVEEAFEAASEWVRTGDPFGSTALGWRVLAEIKFSREDFEGSLWAALNPIAFAGFIPMDHLAECYAYAVLSAKGMRLREDAERLHREMRARGLEWPTRIAELEPELRSINELLPDEEKSAAAEVLEEESPDQTPSPVDPIESLPTRIFF